MKYFTRKGDRISILVDYGDMLIDTYAPDLSDEKLNSDTQECIQNINDMAKALNLDICAYESKSMGKKQFLITYDMPFYDYSLENVSGESIDEKLLCDLFERWFSNGFTHLDIALRNIAYDKKNERYEFIDLDAIIRVKDSSDIQCKYIWELPQELQSLGRYDIVPKLLAIIGKYNPADIPNHEKFLESIRKTI